MNPLGTGDPRMRGLYKSKGSSILLFYMLRGMGIFFKDVIGDGIWLSVICYLKFSFDLNYSGVIENLGVVLKTTVFLCIDIGDLVILLQVDIILLNNINYVSSLNTWLAI